VIVSQTGYFTRSREWRTEDHSGILRDFPAAFKKPVTMISALRVGIVLERLMFPCDG